MEPMSDWVFFSNWVKKSLRFTVQYFNPLDYLAIFAKEDFQNGDWTKWSRILVNFWGDISGKRPSNIGLDKVVQYSSPLVGRFFGKKGFKYGTGQSGPVL